MKIANVLVRAVLALVLALRTVTAQNIVEVAQGDESFGTLVAALEAADLVGALQGDGPFTVFAPTNEAFDKLPNGALDYLLQEDNRDVLTTVLSYHVASGQVLSEALSNGQSIDTLVDGETLSVRIVRHWSWTNWRWTTSIFINDARVTTADVLADNGVIHVIDRVLIPDSVTIPLDIVDTAVSNGLVALLAAVKYADLEDALRGPGPFTVFAPTNEAFAQLDVALLGYLMRNPDVLADVLMFHVVEGSEVRSTDVPTTVTTLGGETLDLSLSGDSVLVQSEDGSSSATVVTPNVDALNGVVHVIDSVLVPPGLDIPGDIVNLANATEELSTLVSALQSADLVDALRGPGPVTVFAPTNAAFEALEEIPTGEELKKVLLYHVAPGSITAQQAINAAPAKTITLNGQFLDITTSEGSVFINDAMVTDADIFALNGVVHIIDQVLIPPPVECHLPAWLCEWLGY